MIHLLGSIEKPVKFYNAGIFKSQEGGFQHASRVINNYEVIYGINDVLYICEEDAKYEVRRGDVLILSPSLTHSGYKPSGRDVSFFWGHFTFHENPVICDNINQVPAFSYLLKNHFHPEMQSKVLLPKYIPNSQNERISILYRELIHIHRSDYYTNLAVNLHMTSLLIEISNQYLKQVAAYFDTNKDRNEILLNHILKCIKLNYTRKYSVKDIGEELGYNTDYLARVFRDNMGMKISNYINYLRIEKAKTLLLESIKTVKEISYEVGFNDDKYFLKLFKNFENISPREFRKTYYKGHYIAK